MTTAQYNRLEMYSAVRTFLAKSDAALTAMSAFPALAEKRVSLNSLLEKIDVARQTQTEILQRERAVRVQLLETVISEVREVAGAARSYALANRRVDLLPALRISAHRFHNLRWIERPVLAQRVHDAVLPIVNELANYGITPASLTALQQKIDAFRDSVDASRNSIAAQKAMRTELVRLFADGEQLMQELDGLMWPLHKASGAVYDEYRGSRQVFDRPGVRSADEDETPPAETPTAPPQPVAAAA